MLRGSSFRPLYRFAVLCLLQTATLLAQSDRGTITGTVLDPGNAVIPNATLRLTSKATGTVYETVSTGTGNYTLPSLPSGIYNLAVTAAGFNQYIQEGIQVQVA